MKYSSVDGCIFYYDRTLYQWQVAETTMLFLLGLESALSYDSSLSDKITFTKYAYDSDSNTDQFLSSFTIIDEIYKFLSMKSSVEDYETYMQYHCNGLKLFMNDLTGTNFDRTVPIIFKNSINTKLLNYTKPIYRLASSDYNLYDLQAQKIKDIFSDTDYNGSLINFSVDQFDQIISGDINRDVYLNDTSYNNRNAVNYISTINEHTSEKLLNKNIYKYLDYKAMYAYSLGVLYGCYILGYNFTSIFYTVPDRWYRGNLKNLVNSAWNTYNFHYRNLLSEDNKHYCYIQDNKLYNFNNKIENSEIELISPKEQLLNLLGYNKNNPNDLIKTTVSYIQDKVTLDSTKGSFNISLGTNWTSVDSILEDQILSCGFVSPNSDPIKRYFLDKEVLLYPAYSIKSNNNENILLAPIINNIQTNYFTDFGNIGWINFDPYSTINRGIPYIPIQECYNDGEQGITRYTTHSSFGNKFYYVINIKDKSLCVCYICGMDADFSTPFQDYLDTNTFTSNYKLAYGIVNIDDKNWEYHPSVKELLSRTEFSNKYTIIKPYSISDKTTVMYYINNKINILIDDNNNYYVDENPKTKQDIISLGYSDTPSKLLVCFNNLLEEKDLLYNSTTKSYWDTTNSPSSWFNQSSYEELNLYIKDNFLVLFKGNNRIGNYQVYLKNNKDTKYFYYTELSGSNIVSFDYLYNTYGITYNECTIITQDDDGQPLVDEDGNFVVWYDPKNHLYWNGLHHKNKWQDNKPSASAKTIMFNAETNESKDVIDDYENHTIIIDDVSVSYDEFYNTTEPIETNGYLYDASTNSLIPANYDDSTLTIEVYDD